jgi:hypothetical protein
MRMTLSTIDLALVIAYLGVEALTLVLHILHSSNRH